MSRQQQYEQLKKLLKRRVSGSRTAGVEIRVIFAGTVIGTLINSLVLVPATWAQTAKLGVVKSPENEGQWSGITSRLQSTGVDYCIIDFAQVQQASDLGSTQLLFLPNIALLKPEQLAALQEWMRQGGRVIVSGPMGTLSQPEVRSQLRSLLGAYWGFSLAEPLALKPLETNSQTWVRGARSGSPIQGGAVIPAGLNSTTAAIWSQNSKPPAVVTTNQSTFFGWNWGVDGVASSEVDSTWLRAALGRYGLTPTPGTKTPNQSQNYCVPSQASTASKPPTPLPNQQQPTSLSKPPTPLPNRQQVNTLPPSSSSTLNNVSQIEPDFGVAPARVIPKTGERLAPRELTAMGQELENLIGRVESALLTAKATTSNVNLQTRAAVEQFLGANAQEKLKVERLNASGSNPQPSNLQPSTLPNPRVAPTAVTDSATRAVTEARINLQNFREAIARSDYNTARQQWSQARRTLWNNYPTDRKLAQPEIRAIWLDRGTIVRAKSEQDLAKIFDQLAAAGFNTVFFETVNASYTIYPSRVAPEQNPLTRGWDPLAAAVKLAHERGMELHAWVWMFAAANQRHNAILNQPADYPGPVVSAHPDWAVVDRQGRLFDHTKKVFLDPANPEVRRYLMRLLDEIATRYEVDGIQLDYIRYSFQDPSVNQTYGYGMAARQQFYALTGVDPAKVNPSDRLLWQRWTDFRIRQIDNFVTTVSQRLRVQRPRLILSAAVFPLRRQERLQKLQQNWESWAIQGDIDLVVPMTYALDTSGLQDLAQPALTESALSSALIVPGIRLLNLPDIVAVDQIQLLRDLPAGGFALFAAENLNTALRNIFSRIQGKNSTTVSEPVPYRQPFPAAAARYAALQREWNFLLANNQILIREPVLSEWGKQADALSTSLNQLAKEPSMKHLSSAKTLLSAFRVQFQRWMQQQSATQPYQVQAWTNRLATIERILLYGERTVLNQYRLKVSEQK
ncbi:MAG TPA: hypothetical protein DCP31_17330 [Cyanobacteria bacterium UBA8543]|nr:hypothetical protein [Cyanobacteria bacterium UBA8543]